MFNTKLKSKIWTYAGPLGNYANNCELFNSHYNTTSWMLHFACGEMKNESVYIYEHWETLQQKYATTSPYKMNIVMMNIDMKCH